MATPVPSPLVPSPLPSFVDIAVVLDGHVAIVEIRRPPHNFFDMALIRQIGTAFEALDHDPDVRAVVLAAEGKSFCAGADFGDGRSLDSAGHRSGESGASDAADLYQEAVRLFRTAKPIIAAVHGAAVGGGLGLALVADFRVTCPEARFAANFTRLGFHPGFGLTHTLPALVGQQHAILMFYTSRRLDGKEAHRIGLADLLVPSAEVRSAALALAAEIATNAPLAVTATRATLRRGLAERVLAQTDHELALQRDLRKSEDFREGIAASAERRAPVFRGR